MNSEETTNIQIIGEVRKGPTMVLRVHCADYRDRPYIYLQLWNRLEGEPGEGERTNLGLTLNPGNLRALLPLLERALEASSSRGQALLGEEAMLDLEARDRRRS